MVTHQTEKISKEYVDEFRGSKSVTVIAQDGGSKSTLILRHDEKDENAQAIHLKYILCKDMGKPYEYASQMKLLYRGKELTDDTLVAPLKLHEDSAIILILKN